MQLFRFLRRNPKYAQEETPLMWLFRYILIVLLFCALIWGFWLNNQRRMERVARLSDASLIDRTGTLTPKQERQLAAFQTQFREAYGMPLLIGITRGPAFADLRAAGAGPSCSA